MSPSHAVLSLIKDRWQDLGKEDMFEITGKNVASKLRILPTEQRIIAEKLINGVLYEAQLGTLTRNSRLILSEPHGYTSPVVHLHYVTEPLTVGSAQHSNRATQPADGQSAQHSYRATQPADGQSAQHSYLATQPADGQSAQHSYCATQPADGQSAQH